MTIREINSKTRKELAELYTDTWGTTGISHIDYRTLATALYSGKRLGNVTGIDIATYNGDFQREFKSEAF